jgi:peptide/nickel transport system permease protein
VLLVALAAFALVRAAPGDATSELRLTGADDKTIEAARHRLGLDQSLPAHLASWMTGLARFDLGQSSRYGRPVADLLSERVLNTAVLASCALLLAVAIGLPLGVYNGSRRGSAVATGLGAVSVALICCPPIIGTLLLLYFAASTGWLSIAPGHMAVPALALALPLAAMFERLQSQAVSDALRSDGLRAAAARGLSPRRLLWWHAARHALQPVLGVSGVMIAALFSGSVAVEVMTSWPGLGRLMLDALVGRDLYLVAGCALAGGTLVALGNFVADVLRAAADPRLRHAV